MKTAAKPAKPVAELDTHSWHVFGGEFSPDGKWLVVATRENQGLALIETAAWKIVHWFSEPNFCPSSLEFSPDQSMLLQACCQDEPLRCWDFKTRKLLWALKKTGQHAAFSPDSKTIATNKSKELLIVNARTGQTLASSPGHHRSRIDFTAFSNDGSRIASVAGSEVIFSDPKNAAPIKTVQAKEGSITNLKFSRCGRFFATASQDGNARVFDPKSGNSISELSGHDDSVWGLEFSPDGNHIFTTSFDATARVWETATARQLQRIQLPQDTSTDQCPISPDGRLIGIPVGFPHHKILVIDWRANKIMREFTRDVLLFPKGTVKAKASPQDLVFSPDGKFIVTFWDDGKTRVWKLA